MKNNFTNIKVMPGMIVGIGELLWDKFDNNKKLGGAPGNFAYHVSQFGLPGCAISAIGNDDDGADILKMINDINIPVAISTVDYPTGIVNITMSGNGIPEYEICKNSAWDYIPFTEQFEEIAGNTIAVCFGSLAQRNEASRNTIYKFINSMPHEKNILKIYDINLRQDFYSKEIIDQSLNLCNILKINDNELDTIAELFNLPGNNYSDRCHELINRYQLRILILTCGEKGSYVFTPESPHSFLPTPKVTVADTVGAGDSFTAAFTASILRGKSISEAHQKAVEISAFVCTQHGAMPKIPIDFL